MTNNIFLHGLKLITKIGVPDWERAISQQLIIDVDIQLKGSQIFDSNDISVFALRGFNSTEAIQYPFFWVAKLDCKKTLKGKGLIPTITLVVSNILPIPILPVTSDGSAKPA